MQTNFNGFHNLVERGAPAADVVGQKLYGKEKQGKCCETTSFMVKTQSGS